MLSLSWTESEGAASTLTGALVDSGACPVRDHDPVSAPHKFQTFLDVPPTFSRSAPFADKTGAVCSCQVVFHFERVGLFCVGGFGLMLLKRFAEFWKRFSFRCSSCAVSLFFAWRTFFSGKVFPTMSHAQRNSCSQSLVCSVVQEDLKNRFFWSWRFVQDARICSQSFSSLTVRKQCRLSLKQRKLLDQPGQ